jgi:hypothetical protein
VVLRPPPDTALRRLLDVNWLSGPITVAAGEDFYAAGIHMYEDGKLVDQSWLIWGSLQPGQSRTIKPEFLWGTLREAPRQVLACEGTSSQGVISAYWTNAMGGVSRLQPGQPVQSTPDGCKIVGYAESQLTREGKLNSVSHGGFDLALKDQKYVGALMVRTFPTKEAQEQFMRQQNRRGQ